MSTLSKVINDSKIVSLKIKNGQVGKGVIDSNGRLVFRFNTFVPELNDVDSIDKYLRRDVKEIVEDEGKFYDEKIAFLTSNRI